MVNVKESLSLVISKERLKELVKKLNKMDQEVGIIDLEVINDQQVFYNPSTCNLR